MRLLLLSTLLCLAHAQLHKPKNVLFLVADDLRPQLGYFQDSADFPTPVHPRMHTPSLDSLAKRSFVSRRAYVQQAVCSPSRTSLLTGRRPDTTHVYDLESYWRKVGGNYTTLPQYFKQQGYRSIGMGKIFHPGPLASGNDDPISWTDPYYHSEEEQHWTERKHSWYAVPEAERQAHPLPDDQIAEHAINKIKELAKDPSQPFFLAVGFHKPHLPFIFPEKFMDLYPSDRVNVPDNIYAPRNMPDIAWSKYGELRSYTDIEELHASGDINTTLPIDVTRDLRRGYYSAISYMDHLLGTVVDELMNQGLGDNTIISFWGDHGWQLGEHGEWCKHTNFELSTHAPMMVSIPGMTDAGMVSEKLTEFVDLFPTLVDAAGLPTMPLCPADSTKTELCREGESWMPLIRGDGGQWKDRVFSQYPRDNSKIMGYTMRTDRFRYTEWVKFRDYKPEWQKLFGVELYDHKIDPEENNNVAAAAAYAPATKQLSAQLRAGWRSARPDDPRSVRYDADAWPIFQHL
ncbi:hypothetical protein CAPTEDRAFT_171703 [Capitella teleta]|uniref:Sulfatase N-terminal domain-containing protein n=1 Tax=Capitella teleta TaxID=283909 RepID=R7UT23_CAPTE|nr:hypothetical protein CAPTEDRAFT_171703 [Capitella teleta]|eukprot:ELU09360.1 hypothetical protein CAPTEDRAFT_171703 [Capitella teleta]